LISTDKFNVIEIVDEPRPSESKANGQDDGVVPHGNLCAPYVWRDPATLPQRGWLYGKHYIRQYVSGSIGEGGVGKSTLGLTEAVAMVLRRPLLGKTPTAPGPLKVWYWNGEDPKVEIDPGL
jgi:AAA domain